MKNKILNVIFSLLALFGVVVSARLLTLPRSLWLDEGMLAWSVSGRPISELCKTPLDLMQSAPILYLYAVKIIIDLFSDTEVFLRLFSFICYILSLALTYGISKKLNIKYPLAVVAAVSGVSVMLRYSCEFKPYMCDVASVLAVIYAYILYKEEKLKLPYLTIVFAALIWLSNPACFFIAGVLVYEFIGEIIRTKKFPLKLTVSGLLVAISFAVYFVIWLYPVIKKGDMSNYWKGYEFPLIPTSLSDIKLAFNLIKDITLPLSVVSIFSLAGLILGIIKRNSKVIVLAVSLIITLLASFMGFYPVSQRLWLFVYPIAVILAFSLFDFKGAAGVIISFALIIATTGIPGYLNTDNAYIDGDDLNPLIKYVDQKDEYLYVYNHSVPTYCYKNEYIIRDNVKLGNGYFDTYNPDIEEIKSHDSGYILISHEIGNRLQGLYEGLRDYNIKLVKESHGSKLYHYKK